jgi:glucokinase
LIGAIDIGGTKIAVGVVDGDGRIIDRAECPTAPERGSPDGLRRMTAMLRQTAARTGAELHGIGIGCTGPVDPFTGVLGTVDLLPGWQGGAIVAGLSEAFHVPVAMENDADAAGLAEAVWGAGRGKRRFLYVTVGTGIGVAIILDGALYRGVDGSHPEIGHQVIDASGSPCYCGARGCWEILASGPAMLAWARNRIAPDHPGEGQLTMMHSSHLFLDRAREVIRQCCALVPFDRAELALASLGADTALAGAAQVWHGRFESERKAHAL